MYNGEVPEWITTGEAARRLGIKRETLYAYVSRGMLTSRRLPDSKESRFDRAEVERLAARSRSGGRAGSLELVVDSALTLLDPSGRLYFRGFDVPGLARTSSFEQVAELLWTGSLPTSAASFEASPDLLDAARRGSGSLKRNPLPVDRIRAALASASVSDQLRFDRSPDAVAATGRRILAVEVAAAGDRRGGLSFEPGTTIARRLWQALTGRIGSETEVETLNAALVLLADHEMASSTLAARVAASTWADPYLVVTAGMAVLGGPLHGSVGDRVAPMLLETVRSGAAEVVGGRLRLGEAVVGFGHLVYRDLDPRAEALWPFLEEAWPDHAVMAEASEVASLVSTFRNVDFALGALVASAGMIDGAAETIFCVARTAGWLAHAIEEYTHRLRYRLRAAYTGPAPVA
jgi:citrate synthase